MKYTETDYAVMDSLICIGDARLVVRHGRQLCDCFDACDMESGTDCPEPTNEVFSAFHDSLYGAGFVMGDFDGPQFDRGPMRLLFIRSLAPQMVQASNLFTIRMFTHTLARSFRAGYYGAGYSPFDNAHQSGGLRAIIERIERYCDFAASQGWLYLQDNPKLDLQ